MGPLLAQIPFSVEGESITPGTVKIERTPRSPEAPLPKRTEYEGEEARTGEFEFEFTKPGNYFYAIKQEPGEDPSVIYDETVYEVGVGVFVNEETSELYFNYLEVNAEGAAHKVSSAEFTNRYKPGSLTVENHINGAKSTADGEVEIEYTVTFTPPVGEDGETGAAFPQDEAGNYYVETDQGRVELTDNGDGTYSGSFTLADGESITFEELPAGTGYDVEAKSVPDGYEFKDIPEENVDAVAGSAKDAKGEDAGIKGEEKSAGGKAAGWIGGEIQNAVSDSVSFTVTGGYAITLTKWSSGDSNPSDWEENPEFGYVQNFSYLSYVAQGQNLTGEPQKLRVSLVVGTYTEGGSTRYLNVEQIDGTDYTGFFQQYTETQAQTRTYAAARASAGKKPSADCGWTYYPDTHVIVFDAEEVEAGGTTAQHVIRTSVPAVNSMTTYTGNATLLPEDSDEPLAEADEVKATSYAEWLRVLVWVGNLNEPEDWQKERDIKFTVRLSDLTETSTTSVHYMFFASEAAYGSKAGEDRTLELTANGDGTYSGSFTLKHSQRAVFYDLHEDDGYVVTADLTDEQGQRYAVYKAGDVGSVGAGKDGDSIDMAVFRLIPVHDLTVEKKTEGVEKAEEEKFTFAIELDVRDTFEDVYRETLYLDMETVNFDDIDGEDEVYETAPNTWTGTITLRGAGSDSSVTYTGIPDGSTYKLKETSTEGYTTAMTVSAQETITSQEPDENGNVKLPEPVVTGPAKGVETSGTFNKANVRVTYENSAIYYTLTYDANGGSGEVPEKVTERENTKVELAKKPKPTKSGAVWIGWSETKYPNAFTEKKAANAALQTSVVLDGDKIVYAVWAVDANGNGIPDYEEAKATATPGPSGSGGGSSPKTGDDSQLMLWLIVMLVALAGVIWFILFWKRRKKDEEDGQSR